VLQHEDDDSLPSGTLELHLPDEAATLALGARLARALQPGLYIELLGDLGAGKTTLVRGLLRALGYQGRVKSPTFTLLEHYSVLRFNLYHFDLYRFEDPEEWLDAGFREHFNRDSVCLVEWPQKAAGCLPRADVTVRLAIVDQGAGRQATLLPHTPSGKQCLAMLATGG
jgi:tRNA threonylcarbamoyladenosine biosynthesis protein TsaE